MTIYTINLAIVILLGNILCQNKQYGKKAFVTLVCIQLILLAGLRADTVGTDTWGYVNLYFQQAIDTSWNLLFIREGGYYLLTKIISLISTEYPILLTILAAIPLVLICISVYMHSRDVLLSITVFITLRAYAFLFTGIRQSIALGICFYSYRFIKEKRFLPFAACILTAATFHISAIIFLSAYFLSKIKLNIKNMTFAMLTIPLILLLRTPILMFTNVFLNPLGYQYQSDISFKDGGSTILYSSLILIVGLMHRKQMIKKNAESETLLLFILISVFLYGLGYIISPFTRIAIYFGWFMVLLLPQIINIFEVAKERFLIKLSVYAILFAQFLYFGPGFSLVPYKFFWQGS